MGGTYRVRLEDGVEMGPLDDQMLRSWFQQGMVDPDTRVRPAGKKQWVRLRDAVDIRDWEVHGWSGDGSGDDVYEGDEGSGPQEWRTYVGSVVFFLAAAGAAFFAFFPDRWLPSLAMAPWREIALGHVALGLLLVRGWEPARKLVRVLICVLAFALFPVAGAALVLGLPGRALAVLFSAWVMGSGMFFFLTGRALPTRNAVLSLLWALAGAGGVGFFGLIR
jgi:uncharacterized protein DUF4339